MAACRLRSVNTICVAACCALTATALGADQADDDFRRIAELQTQLFVPVLKAGDLTHLLRQLEDPQKHATAKDQLVRRGQGHQQRITEFARASGDLEARQACADIVAALDSSYRTTDAGKKLGILYRKHTTSLLATAWKHFRENPLDLRAVSMLMHGDAEVIYNWLGKQGEKNDQLRFLLLRVRELTPDAFVAKHLKGHSASAAHLVLQEVFPIAGYRDGPNLQSAIHRVVGHTALNATWIARTGAPNEIPKLSAVGSSQRWTYLARTRYAGNNVAILKWNTHSYNTSGVSRRWSDIHTYLDHDIVLRRFQMTVFGSAPRGICPLPLVDVTRENTPKWYGRTDVASWLKPLIPASLHKDLKFFDAGPAPRILNPHAPVPLVAPRVGYEFQGPRDSAAPTVVVLPPLIIGEPNANLRAAAESLCDRLAQEFDASRGARVVDRRQLEQVLREKILEDKLDQPLTSYDAMLRVEIDVDRLLPQTRVSVVEFSTGSALAEQTVNWPVREDELESLGGACRAAVGKILQGPSKKPKVRALTQPDYGNEPRLRHLAERLAGVFDDVLAGSDKIQLVRHLEASSSKEESLLLFMGLSRLSGQRRFAPHADVTVELRLREEDAVGRPFSETGIEIGVRVQKDARSSDDWITIASTVKTFDAGIDDAWRRLAEELSQLQPDAAAKTLDDMKVRRQQADAELRAAEAIGNLADLGRNEEQLLARLSHTEAAIKLEPSNEAAAYDYLKTKNSLLFHHWRKYRNTATMHDMIAEALRYRRRFEAQVDPMRCAEVHYFAAIPLKWTELNRFREGGETDLTAQILRSLDGLKQLTELSVGGDLGGLGHWTQYMMMAVYRGMRSRGVPIAQRQQWIDSILQASDRQASVAHTSPIPDFYKKGRLNQHYFIRLTAAELAVEDGQVVRSMKIMAELQARLEQRDYEGTSLQERMQKVMTATNDPEALAKYNQWADRFVKVVPFIRIDWPKIDIYEKAKLPTPKRTIIGQHRLRGFAGLTEVDNRYYFVVRNDGDEFGWRNFVGTGGGSRSDQLAFIDLDQQGRPTGTLVNGRNARPIDRHIASYSGVEMPSNTHFQIHACRNVGAKLCFSTPKSGVLVHDPKTAGWQKFGVEQGVPSPMVYSLYALDNHTLYCTCAPENERGSVHFLLDLRNGDVTLVHRGKRLGDQYLPQRLVAMWKSGDQWKALDQSGSVISDLLSDAPRRRKFTGDLPYAWPVRGDRLYGVYLSAEIGGRRFFIRTNSMHEMDDAGEIVRSWWGRFYFNGGLFAGSDSGVIDHIVSPRDSLVQGAVVRAGQYLALQGDGRLVVYDPKTDTWYGPVLGGTSHMAGSRAGLWLGNRMTLTFVATGDIIEAAREAGRVVTSAEFRRRKQQFLDAASSVDRAKLYFAMRQFDRAASALAETLDAEPYNAEALLLAGYMHHRWHQKNWEDAVTYYERLASVNDPRASLTGRTMMLVVAREQKQWRRVVEIGEDLIATFPKIDERARQDIDRWLAHGRKQLGKIEDKR